MTKTPTRPTSPSRSARHRETPKAPASTSPDWVQVKVPVNDRMADFLNRLGARSDRGRSRWSFANVVREQFDLFLDSLDESDPRLTRDFPQSYYDLTVELLTEPWSLNSTTIKILDAYISKLPNLKALLAESRVRRDAFLAAIAELTYAERLHLVEAAHVRHAPRSEPGSPDL